MENLKDIGDYKQILKELDGLKGLPSLKSEYDEIILQPLSYLRQKPYVTTKLMIHNFNYWLKIPTEKLDAIEEIMGLVVDNSYIIDDVIDEGMIRRGQTTAHVACGIPATIACCEYVNFLVIEKLLELDHPDAIKVYLEAGLIGYQGQAVDVYLRDVDKCPTLSEYLVLACTKASIYFVLLYKLMQLFSDNKKNLFDFMNLFGIFGQYRNDYRNLFMPEEDNKKEVFADDLSEGKFTFPLIYAVHTLKCNEVFEIVKQRPKDVETKRRCVKILKDNGTQEHCLAVLHQLHKKLYEEAAKIGPNPFMEFAIDHLMDFK